MGESQAARKKTLSALLRAIWSLCSLDRCSRWGPCWTYHRQAEAEAESGGGLASEILEGECLSVHHTEKVTGVEQQWGLAEAGQGIVKGTFGSPQRLQVTWKESRFSKVTLCGTKKVLCKQAAGWTSPRNPASWTRQWCQRAHLVSKSRDREPSIRGRWLGFRGRSP